MFGDNWFNSPCFMNLRIYLILWLEFSNFIFSTHNEKIIPEKKKKE